MQLAEGDEEIGEPFPTEQHAACRFDVCLLLFGQRTPCAVQLAEVDEEVGELFLMEQPVDSATLQAAVRRATLALQFVPVFVGSAYKNKAGFPDIAEYHCRLSASHGDDPDAEPEL